MLSTSLASRRGPRDRPARFLDLAYALNQDAFSKTDAYRAMASYWRDRLREPVETLELPLAVGRPAERSFRGGRLDSTLPTELVRSLTELSSSIGCSLYTVLFGGLAVCLAERGRQSKVMLGMPVAGQALSQQHYLVGSCLRYLPLDRSVGSDPSG